MRYIHLCRTFDGITVAPGSLGLHTTKPEPGSSQTAPSIQPDYEPDYQEGFEQTFQPILVG